MQLIPEHTELHLTIKIEFLHIIKPLVLNLILQHFLEQSVNYLLFVNNFNYLSNYFLTFHYRIFIFK